MCSIYPGFLRCNWPENPTSVARCGRQRWKRSIFGAQIPSDTQLVRNFACRKITNINGNDIGPPRLNIVLDYNEYQPE